MSLTSTELGAGPGWQVRDVVCNSGPGDPPFEERHEAACIALVTDGSFQYRTRAGEAALVPGAMLLGDHGACYECGHEHGTGDRCLSFHFAPEYLEAVNGSGTHRRGTHFSLPQLPPLRLLMRLAAEAEAARDAPEIESLEEIAARLAYAVLSLLDEGHAALRRVTARQQRRVAQALQRIEAEAHEPLSLAEMARGASMSPYHFLRTFREMTGMTPHQYVLRTRLHRAAVGVRRTREPISKIALEAGFNDLSTFNRRFRRFMGMSPSEFRARS